MNRSSKRGGEPDSGDSGVVSFLALNEGGKAKRSKTFKTTYYALVAYGRGWGCERMGDRGRPAGLQGRTRGWSLGAGGQ